MRPIVACSNVTKSYGRHEAVRGLDLMLEERTIYGLLGRNGAGKTTLLNMIVGSLFPDSGVIEVGGIRLRAGETPAQVCYIREKNLYPGSAKVIDVLQMASAFHPNWDWDYARELLQAFRLNPAKKIRQLSRGMESLVGNIVGLASRAPLTIFDEPVLGLDVLMRERFYRALVEDWADHPRTILFSTHLIDEIAKVVEKVYILEAGTMLLHDEVDRLHTQAHLFRGTKESVSAAAANKRILYKETYGGGMLAAVYDSIGERERATAAKLGVSIEGLPLQKFFTYLIEGGESGV
ncbi:ABC transporter ATP-binding protein [Paenibacillus aurantius]|uniref:ABC transporter ATP-binding protein n=1 Tax=Paenibacillus aurantius TaxID=2918900 RepID=A0AA96LFQ9_9BACL|nr:ABC transporter ATP-binding protein [Paenibacillus aurantius]WNQ11176.1 ABC transporter ATP-binding protein [Paenibacillus aurantius]